MLLLYGDYFATSVMALADNKILPLSGNSVLAELLVLTVAGTWVTVRTCQMLALLSHFTMKHGARCCVPFTASLTSHRLGCFGKLFSLMMAQLKVC